MKEEITQYSLKEHLDFKEEFRQRLSKPMDKDLFEFISSTYQDIENLWSIEIDTTYAHCLALHKEGYISNEQKDKIKEALRKITKEKVRIYEFVDIHPIIEDYLLREVGEAGRMVNLAKSRNEQIATDLRIYTREKIIQVCDELLEFVDTLLQEAQNNTQTLFIYYTHLQPASATTYSHYLLSFIEGFLRNIKRYLCCLKRTNLSPCGSSAGTGSLVRIDREYLKDLLGFDGLVENTQDAVLSRDFIDEFLFINSLVAIQLNRLAEDFMILSSFEFSYIDIDESLCDVSSVMPQKKNPVLCEMVRAKVAYILSVIQRNFLIQKNLNTGYNLDLQEIKDSLFKQPKELIKAINMSKKLIKGVRINQQRIKENIKKSFAYAKELVEYLVEKKKENFRDAYKKVAFYIREGKSLNELIDEDIENFLLERYQIGSPNPKIIQESLVSYKQQINRFFQKIKELKSKYQRIKEELWKR